MTNKEKLINGLAALSDEALASIMTYINCDDCPIYKDCRMNNIYDTCYNFVIKWLKGDSE